MEGSVLQTLLALLGIGQFITGAISWYFGMQVKMLRLELVNKEVCQARHDALEKEINAINVAIAEHHGQGKGGCRHA